MDTTLILAILGILVTAFIPLLGYLFKVRKDMKNYYSVIWKSSSSLKVKDMLGERPYNAYYYERSEDAILKRNLERRNNVLLIGPPLIGKTRAVYEQLKNLNSKADVLIPRSVSMPAFSFPKDLKFWRKKMIFIDDLQYYIEKQDNYYLLFNKAKEAGISITATCHSGQEFKKVKNKMLEQSIDIDNLFSGNIIEYEKLSPETGKQISEKLEMEWDPVKFNGTIGGIFMRLSEMERRYDNCSDIEKTLLQTLRMMYIAGLFSDNNIFSMDWIKLTSKKHELEGKDFEWTAWMKSLEGKEFLKVVRRNKIWVEDAYLQFIVKPDIYNSDAEIFEDMVEIFSGEPSALLMIAERAYDTGSVDLNAGDYMRCAINACENAISRIGAEDIPLRVKAYEYAGRSYWALSRIENTVQNNIKALEYYNEALKLINKDSYPLEYARLQNKMGNSYSSIGINNEDLRSCKEAVRLYKEALQIFSAGGRYSYEYARVCNNLGAIYHMLAQMNDTAGNLNLAIESLKKALLIRTLEKYPKEYADTQNNLGNTYSLLADTENKVHNLKLAIECYENYLNASPKKKYPLNYSLALTNIGRAYTILAEEANVEMNCKKAGEYLNRALEIRTPERFPIQYGSVQHDIGINNLTLAKHNNDPETCHKALDAFEESLAYRKKEIYPAYFASCKTGIGDAYTLLAGLEDKSENYRKALAAYDEALTVFTEEANPASYAFIMDKISKAKKIFF